ncbi:MAG: PAS domain S-box protein [Clostridiales bacterium]|jgi:PAS domain S-box-containing protein|nr:PAS domain S-box protein [Clostridiales bacterium]MDR2751928.1 PAS domain S-box protein [Clostridiales bacterium]
MKKSSFIVGNIYVVFELIAIGVIAAVAWGVYESRTAGFSPGALVFLNTGALIALYIVCRLYFSYLMRRNVKLMAKGIQSVLKDTGDWKGYEYRYELALFYEELDKLKSALRKKEETRQEILAVVNSVAVNMDFDKVLEDLMPKLIEVTGSNCCAFYSLNPHTNKLEIKRSLGFSKNIYSEFDLTLGEGFIGATAANSQTTVVMDIPEDSVYMIRTFLGKLKPKSMLVAPISYHDQMTGVMVFASIHEYTADEMEMVELIKYYIGVAVANGLTYEKTKRLGNELKFQNKLIQNLNEELENKVANRSLFLNNIIDSIQDYAIYAMDKNGIIQTWNKGADLLLGFTAEEAIGKQMEHIYKPEEKESVRKRLTSVLQEGKYIENGWRFRKDGTKFFYEMKMFVMYNERREIIGISNITKDMTSIKSVESALWFEKEVSIRILESSSRALIFTDEAGVIILANHNAEILLEQEFLSGRGIYEFFEDSEALAEAIVSTADHSYFSEMECRLRDEVDMVKLQLNVMFDDVTGSKKLFISLAKV